MCTLSRIEQLLDGQRKLFQLDRKVKIDSVAIAKGTIVAVLSGRKSLVSPGSHRSSCFNNSIRELGHKLSDEEYSHRLWEER